MIHEPCDHHIQADKLARLQHNWDSYGAPAVNPAALALALTCLRSAVIVPMHNGTVQVELRAGEVDIELEFMDGATVGFGFFRDVVPSRRPDKEVL